MAGNRRDVELVIRARDEASKSAKAISDALNGIVTASDKLSRSGGGASEALNAQAVALGKVEGIASKAADSVGKAEAAFADQVGALDRSQQALAAYKQQAEAAQVAIVNLHLAQRDNGGTGVDPARTTAAVAEYQNLNRIILTTERNIATQSARLESSAGALSALRAGASATSLALGTFGNDAERSSLKAMVSFEALAGQIREAGSAASSVKGTTQFAEMAEQARVLSKAREADANSLIAELDRVEAKAAKVAAELRNAREEANRPAPVVNPTLARAQGFTAGDTATAAAFDEELRRGIAAEDEMAAAAARLRAQIDPLGAAQAKLNVELAEARGLYAAGKIDATELAAAEKMLALRSTEAAEALKRQGRSNSGPGLFGLKPYELTNLGYQVNDVVTGLASGQGIFQIIAQQGGQILQLVPNIGAKLLAVFTNPYLLAASAVFGTIAVAISHAADEAQKLRSADAFLTSLADGAKYSGEALVASAQALEDYGVKAADAAAVVKVFVRDGFHTTQIDAYARSSKDLADVLGVDVKDAAKQVADAFDGGYASVAKLDDATQFLTATQLEHIKSLFDEGRASDARSEAFTIFAAKQDAAAEKSRGPWAEATMHISSAWSHFLDNIANTAPIQTLIGWIDSLGQSLDGLAGKSTLAELNVEIRKMQTALLDMQKLNGGVAPTATTDRLLLAKKVAERDALLKAQATKGPSGETATERQLKADDKLAQSDKAALAAAKVITDTQRLKLSYTNALNAAQEAGASKEGAAAHARAAQAITQLAIDKEHAATAAKAAASAKTEAAERAKQAKLTTLIAPANGPVTSGFGFRASPGKGGSTNHLGEDIGVPIGTSVRAPAAGRVIKSEVTAKGGLTLTLDLGNGYKAAFAHLSEAIAKKGDFVTQGQVVAKSGNSGSASTGAHLHYALSKNDVPIDPRKTKQITSTPGEVVQDGIKEATKLETAQENFDQELSKQNKLRLVGIESMRVSNGLIGDAALAEERKRTVIEAVTRAQEDAIQKGVTFSAEQRADIEKTTASYFDLQHAREAATNARDDATLPLEDLQAQRDSLQQQIEFYIKLGQPGLVDGLSKQLSGVEDQLKTAAGAAVEYYEALRGDPAAQALIGIQTETQLDNMIAKLKMAQNGAKSLGYVFGVSLTDVAQKFTGAAVSGLDRFAQSVANGENVFKSFGQAFLSVASSFLLQIAQMIEQQIIFNLVSGLLRGIGGGASPSAGVGAIAGLQAHSGGVIGGAGPTPRTVSPAWFTNALRFHGGGMPGLKPNEIPTILERGEEVLTAGDVRHRANGGGAGASPGRPQDIKIVNAVDSASVIQEGLNTRVGTKAILNFVTANKRSFKAALAD